MKGNFVLTAVPMLLRESAHKGQLEYISFIATDRVDTHKWSSTNTGTYAQDFALVVDAGNACDILTRLRGGETVLFPGHYRIEEINDKFGDSTNE